MGHIIEANIGIGDNECFQVVRAAGADDGKRPAWWRDLPSGREFCEHISANIGLSDIEIFQALNESGQRMQPAVWARQEATRRFAAYIVGSLNLTADQVFEAKPGRDGGTWARGEGAPFVEFIAESLNTPVGLIIAANLIVDQDELFQVVRGGRR